MDGIRDEARGYYADDAAHGWKHAVRVEELAARIADEEGAEVHVVRLGAVLHDIGRAREARGEVDDHAEWGAEETRRLLDGRVDAEVREAVVHCVEAHRYSTPPEPCTVEARVVSDADNLDALGAVGVARAFVHGDGFDSTARHAREKLLRLRDRIHTETAGRIADDRHAYLADFFDRFDNERNISRERNGRGSPEGQ